VNSSRNSTNNKKRARGCLITFSVTLLLCLIIIIFVGFVAALLYLQTIPSIEDLTPSPIAETSKVYAIDGSLLTEFHAGENREIIPFEKMSQHIKDAIVSVEDKRFYDHTGVDYRRIIGALIADIRYGKIVQGGSTITQQYVKNVYFTSERTMRRKINEAIIAIQLERYYTKDKILEMYLNTIFFGAGAYGIEKAAQTYFNVHASELSIPQAALLAGLVRAPEIYNPFNDIEKAKARRNLILKLMYDQGFINKNEFLSSLITPVELNLGQKSGGDGTGNRTAPYFIDYVKQQLYEKKFTDYDVFKGGLRIYTTIDLDLQKKAEEAVFKVFPEDPGPSNALVSMDPKNGYIYALIGGKDYNASKFNTATQGKRQPGSIFKVPVLMESIRQHMSPNDMYNPNGPIIIDMPSGPDWKVDNYGGQKFETNDMTVIDATIHSVNVVYAQLVMRVGAENVEKLCNEMDIPDIGNNPAIALGGLEKGITPLDVAKIFSMLAANGAYREPVCILKITDSEGNVLFEYDPDKNEKNRQILDPPTAYYVTSILQRVITEGTGRGAGIGRPAAGKTGTTTDNRDAWFAGYTPELATVVWMGYLESSKPMDKINGRTVFGGTFPADIWREFMIAALKDRPITDFVVPEGILIDVEVCTESRLLPTFWCPKEKLGYMIFVKGKEPKDFCNIHNKVTVPDVIGKHIDEARQIFTDLNFIINEIYQFNDTYNENIIFNQEPEPNYILESLTSEPLGINLYISKGLQTYAMPYLIGLSMPMAEQIIASLGLSNPEVIIDFSDQQPEGKVFAQNPPADSTINKSTQVTIYISKGENPESVIPDVMKMTEQDAVNNLSNAGFKNITVITEESKNEILKVFAQIPEPGTTYMKTSEVIIKISRGIEVPDVAGMKKNDAVTKLENLGFIVIIVPDTAGNNNVINQIPAAKSYLNYGTTVTIEIEDTKTTEPTEPTETTAGPA